MAAIVSSWSTMNTRQLPVPLSGVLQYRMALSQSQDVDYSIVCRTVEIVKVLWSLV